MYLNIDKGKIQFIDLMNTPEIAERMDQCADQFNHILEDETRVNKRWSFLQRILLIFCIINFAVTLLYESYRKSLLSIWVAIGIILAIVIINLFYQYVNYKLAIRMSDIFTNIQNVVRAKNLAHVWQSIVQKISIPSTRLDFKMNNNGEITINTFWIDDSKRAHNDIFTVPKDMINRENNEDTTIELTSPLGKEDYIKIYLPENMTENI